MSNHLHVVVQVIPEASASWNADEVAKRWTRLYPRENQDTSARARIDVISKNRQEAECALGPVLGLPGFGVQR